MWHMHLCCPQHLRMVTARIKSYRKTEEDGKQKRETVERSGHEIKNSQVQSTALAYRFTGTLLPEAVDELPN